MASGRIFSSSIGAAIQAFVGVVIITISPIISGFWFKHESD